MNKLNSWVVPLLIPAIWVNWAVYKSLPNKAGSLDGPDVLTMKLFWMLAGVPVTEQINQHYKRTRQKEKENSQEGNDI